jgi:L-amino acid N-acyltransferase YncA
MREIRRARSEDWPEIWEIFRAVVATGDTFAWPPETTEAEAFAYWMAPNHFTYVLTDDGVVVGSYFFRTNQPGLGSHVANAGFMVSPDAGGRGIGRAMGEHCLAEARAAGYAAMQFNYVVSTNERAVALWKSLGFAIVGTLPKAFHHQQLGLVDAYVMYRFLD